MISQVSSQADQNPRVADPPGVHHFVKVRCSGRLLDMSGIDDFFDYAKERYAILLRRRQGRPRPWTIDPILQHHRFCNIFREDDRTTEWFRKNVRDPLDHRPEVLLATVLFRWFNRITTGEAIFNQTTITDEGDVHTAFEKFLIDGNIGHLKNAIMTYCGDGPYVTGAFIINTPTGMTKLDGVLWAFGEFARGPWKHVGGELLRFNDPSSLGHAPVRTEGMPWVERNWGLEAIWTWLQQFPRLGTFMAYEIVTDLRHTAMLGNAYDIFSWANPGPGARRGLSYICGGDRHTVPREVRYRAQQIEMMKVLQENTRNTHYWPYGWPSWEMRDVEHTLCEFAKYEMVRRGEGRTKGVFHGATSSAGDEQSTEPV